ncbi:BRCT domain-containing protein [Plasmodium yoelii yoelii]|uniref:BRCT domain-containing protein n=1 Tax=Plasmodium yoelii yoelii TaxID=73239 RepID=A0AAF0B6T1_PLAYO|nr:BRCT domain-containing protein [Plasmodium yoelii yoelii]
MVNYDDVTQTLLIDRIKIQYDSNSHWHKYLKYSLRNPHSFDYPDKLYIGNCNNNDFDYFNSVFLSKGYKLRNIEKVENDDTEGGTKKYLLEIEMPEEKEFMKTEEMLIRKIVHLFKECMYYFMCFNEKDGQILEKYKNQNNRDIKDNSEYELFKSLNDCIIQLHDSRIKKNQALIMTNEFSGIFTPEYVKLTKYSDGFLKLLKENNIKYYDLFYEEMQNNDTYKKKKQHYENLKNSSFVPLTKGEISLAAKKNVIENDQLQNLSNKCIYRDKGGKERKKKKKKKKRNDGDNPNEQTRKRKHEDDIDGSSEQMNLSNSDEKNVDEKFSESCDNVTEEKKNGETNELGIVLYDNEEIYNYLNIQNPKKNITDNHTNGYDEFNNKNGDLKGNAKIFNLLNKQVDSEEYIYNELKGDFMKEINLPNNYNYDVNIIEICEKDVKYFYRCVAKHINKKKDKIKVYYIISNFIFFFSKMYKNTINFDDNVHKDINRNFDYKSIIIQGNMIPYNFYILLKALYLMNTYNVMNNLYIMVDYDERKNKSLHFLNMIENKFYDNFRKFEKNIKSNFIYIHKFLQNIIPINKFLLSKGNIYKNSENIPSSFVNDDLLQLQYNPPTQGETDAIVLYQQTDNHTSVNNCIIDNSSVPNTVQNVQHNYIIYDPLNSYKNISNVIKRHCKIIEEKDVHKIINELNDINDNYTKYLLKEKKLLYTIEGYEKNTLIHNILLNQIFFDTYISSICIYYINNYMDKYEEIKAIPLFKPSYINIMINQIKKKKIQKAQKKDPHTNQHTVDKLCNNFFKNSFASILNTQTKDEQSRGVYSKEAPSQLHNADISFNDNSNTSLNMNNPGNNIMNKIMASDTAGVGNELENVNVAGNGGAQIENPDIQATISTDIQNNGNNITYNEMPTIINESIIRKQEMTNSITCIFAFINDNNTNVFNKKEKEIRELILYVLKKKEAEYSNDLTKYTFKYRNSINDAITSSEIEIRKYDNKKIFIFGIVLSNDISNPKLQVDINSLYNLNETLHKKYNSKKFFIQTDLFTFYWIYEVHVYGFISLKGKESDHRIINHNDNIYRLPYDVKWENKVLWGYYLYVIQDSVDSKYSEETIRKLRQEGINLRLCSEQFDVKIVEDDINEILSMHDLCISDLKYLNKNIFMNIIFLIENGHLTYFGFINTDNMEINQKNHYISINIFKKNISFPSYNFSIPLLNDSWITDVLSSQALLPFNNYFYKF